MPYSEFFSITKLCPFAISPIHALFVCSFFTMLYELCYDDYKPVVPKVWGAPPWGGGARDVWRKKIERNLHLEIFSELYLPCIYHPVVITNFITL
jgi:hypothetical protein